jgi:hypothetical protein
MGRHYSVRCDGRTDRQTDGKHILPKQPVILLWNLLWPYSVRLASKALFKTSVRVRVRVTLQLTVSQSVCLGVEPNSGLLTRDIFFFFESYSLVLFGAPSLTRGRVCHLSVMNENALLIRRSDILTIVMIFLSKVQRRNSSSTTNKLRGLSPRANYTYRATAACRRSDCQLLRIEGAKWSAWRIPPAVFSVF